MDLKDLILLGGALLIAAVVGHGVWIAWRSRRDPLKLKIDERLIAAVGDREPAQTDFPNGGARLVRGEERTTERYEPEPVAVARSVPDVPASNPMQAEPVLAAAPPLADETPAEPEPAPRRAAEPVRPAARPATPARGTTPARATASREPPPAEGTPEELILINVLAPREQPFTGPQVVEALRANALRFGEMNIFHRIDTATRVFQFSVANVIEPGTFDVAEIDDFRTPGLCFFLRLPGPESPLDAFEDMQRTARDVAQRLGGELKDERRSVLTAQTVEHYRSRVAEFCRRRMSIRA